jgi:hypothetical protein
MKLISEYVEQAIHFEQMAARETDQKLRTNFLNQAAAYYKLARKRARQLNVPFPPPQKISN